MTILNKYESFLQQVAGNPFDCRVPQNITLFENFKPVVSQKLQPFAKNKAGCLFCFWKEEQQEDKWPVVWLDSEGTPNVVFADNGVDFFSMLPYGTGLIYDIIRSCERYVNAPDTFDSPEVLFADSYATLQKNTIGLYENSMQLKVSSTPAQLIFSAYKKWYDVTNIINQGKL
jgi:hypothetical protein